MLDRLRQIKRRYDPDNLFHDNFNIDPSPDDDAGTETETGQSAGEEAA